MTKRVHAIFRGRVQGVGFRFTAESIAADLEVLGWVRNLPGGDVEILAEQNESILKDFLRQIEEQFAGYIQDKQVSWENATGEFKDFGIKHLDF
ncbi:MAG: acylphosphatase [Candidatus Omnitrophota bacterium]